MNAQNFRILEQINDERNRQDQLKQQGKFARTCADGMSTSMRLSVLAEEYGEVAHEVNETIGGHRPLNVHALRTELIQVGAVALACLEGSTLERGRWERLEEIEAEELVCRRMRVDLPNGEQDNLERLERFSQFFSGVVRAGLGATSLRRLAMACMNWVAALENDVLRNAQVD